MIIIRIFNQNLFIYLFICLFIYFILFIYLFILFSLHDCTGNYVGVCVVLCIGTCFQQVGWYTVGFRGCLLFGVRWLLHCVLHIGTMSMTIWAHAHWWLPCSTTKCSLYIHTVLTVPNCETLISVSPTLSNRLFRYIKFMCVDVRMFMISLTVIYICVGNTQFERFETNLHEYIGNHYELIGYTL